MMKNKTGENLTIKIAFALCAGFVAAPSLAQELTPTEQSVIETFRNFSQCVEDHRPLRLKAEENYRQQLDMREAYIKERAEELARKRADAAMHIIMGSALSEGMTAEEADRFVQNIVLGDALTIRNQLRNLVDRPQEPSTSTEHCQLRMSIDLPTLNTQVRLLTEKYGQDILNGDAERGNPMALKAPAPAHP